VWLTAGDWLQGAQCTGEAAVLKDCELFGGARGDGGGTELASNHTRDSLQSFRTIGLVYSLFGLLD